MIVQPSRSPVAIIIIILTAFCIFFALFSRSERKTTDASGVESLRGAVDVYSREDRLGDALFAATKDFDATVAVEVMDVGAGVGAVATGAAGVGGNAPSIAMLAGNAEAAAKFAVAASTMSAAASAVASKAVADAAAAAVALAVAGALAAAANSVGTLVVGGGGGGSIDCKRSGSGSGSSSSSSNRRGHWRWTSRRPRLCKYSGFDPWSHRPPALAPTPITQRNPSGHAQRR